MLSANLVLRNGNIKTFDPARPQAQALAIMDGKIVAVGSNKDVENLIGPDTRVLDVGQRLVVPGLHDSHIHTVVGATNDMALSFAACRSIHDIQATLKERVAETPSGQWILAGGGWHETQLTEGRLPTRYELDEVAPEHPVLIRRGGHVATANSAALKIADITKDTPDPKGGAIARDPKTGEPNGLLWEPPAFRMVLRHMPTLRRDHLIAGIKAYTAKLNRKGITSTLEPGISLEEIAAYMDIWRAGSLTTRARILQRVSCLDDVDALSSVLAPDFGDDWLRIGGFKFMADGGVEGAYLSQRHNIVEGEQTDPDFYGKMLLPPGGLDELRQMFERAASRSWQMQVHAVGDATITTIVDLMEQVDQKHSLKDARWVVMHLFLPQLEALKKMKRLGLYAAMQDHPILLAHNMIRYWGEERAARAIPVKTVLAAGIPVAAGTDAPIVEWNPFESLWWLVTRKVYVGGKVRVLGAEEAVSREEALRLFTVGSAQLNFVEGSRGTLSAGKLADIAVFSRDFFTVPEDDIRSIESVLTIVGGRIVHQDL